MTRSNIPRLGVPTRFVFTICTIVLVLGASASLAGGCSASIGKARSNDETDSATAVATVTVAEQAMPRYLALTGSLIANRESKVAADAAGRVRETFIERGSVVKAGDVLIQLDGRSARLSRSEAHAQAEASLSQFDNAQRECSRAKRLLEQRVIGQAEYDRQSSQCAATQWSMQAALARAQLAQKTLGDAAVRAPFAGMVVERSVSLGEYVSPATTIAALVEIDPLRLQLTVPESDIGRVHEGQAVEFEVTAFPGRRFHAQVALVTPAIRQATRDRVLEAIVDNADRTLLPGMFALARIEIARDARPVVPASAIRGYGNHSRIFAVVQGRLEERLVQIGEREGDLVALEKGVTKGERIAGTADINLRDGLRVE